MNPYMVYPQLAPSDVQSAPKLPWLTADIKTHDELGKALSDFFSKFGEVQKTSYFHDKEKEEGFFLVCFSCASAALNAAHSTGCGMFGFCAVRVYLNEITC